MRQHSPRSFGARLLRRIRITALRNACRLFCAEPTELNAVLWSFATFFAILGSYFMLRPIRETLATELGVQSVPFLMTGTFCGMLIAVPLYSAAIVRWPRQTAITWIFRFLIANLGVFAGLFAWAPSSIQTQAYGVFYVWLSVFNLFAVAIFWSVMAELFRVEQGRRLFGPISAGGSLGGLAGSLAAAGMAGLEWSISAIMVVAMVVLQISIFCRGRVIRTMRTADSPARELEASSGASRDHGIGGGAWSGFGAVLRSPILGGICGFVFIGTAVASVVYMAQLKIVDDVFVSREQRIEVFARINVAAQAGSLVVQLFLVSRLLGRAGVSVTLMILPLVYVLGMTSFALMPAVATIFALEVTRRVAAYAVAKPTRDILFTLVSLEQKYKAKSFIDMVVYRGGDVVGAWLFSMVYTPALLPLGFLVGSTLFAFVPLAGVWLVISLALGNQVKKRFGAVTRAEQETPSRSRVDGTRPETPGEP